MFAQSGERVEVREPFLEHFGGFHRVGHVEIQELLVVGIPAGLVPLACVLRLIAELDLRAALR
jgi:hypothetical protein